MDVLTAMNVVLQQVLIELEDDGNAESLCASAVYPGLDVPLDFGPESDADGSCAGTLSVNLTGAYYGDRNFQESVDMNDCRNVLNISVDVSIFRSAKLPEENAFGSIIMPSKEDTAAEVRLQYQDMLAMSRAFHALNDDDVFSGMSLGGYIPEGPSGGFIGGTWSLTIEVSDESISE